MSEEATIEDQLMSTDPPPQTSENESGNDEKEESEEEYEIEAILDAKRGMFGGRSRMGYFVKWKGYGEDENSWVDERDAGGAVELIRDFWNKRPKAQPPSTSKGRKSAGSTRPRKSGASESMSSVPNKRALNGSDSEADMPNGKRTRSNDNSEVPASILAELANKKSWEKDIKEVETCEKDANGVLTVYFSMHNGKRCKEEHRIARQRFPQRLLDFYERSIAWRDENGELVDRA